MFTFDLAFCSVWV